MTARLSSLFAGADIAALSGSSVPADIEQACDFARSSHCTAVLVNPCFVQLCSTKLTGSEILCGAVLSFPLGCDQLAVRLYAAQQAVLAGAQRICSTLSTGMILCGDLDGVRRDTELLFSDSEVPVSVLMDASALSTAQLAAAAKAASESGASGIIAWASRPDTPMVDNLHAMMDATSGLARVKPYNPAYTAESVQAMLDAGACGVVISEDNLREIYGAALGNGEEGDTSGISPDD